LRTILRTTTDDCLANPLWLLSQISKLSPSEQSCHGNRGQIGANCLVESALLDLAAKSTDTRLFPCSYRSETPITLTIPLLPISLYRLAAKWATSLGYQQFKLKTTGDSSLDHQRLATFEAGLRGGENLRIDLNGALTAETAVPYLDRLAKSHPAISWIEEPLQRSISATTLNLQHRYHDRFIFCADESCCSQPELQKIINQKSFAAVNLRVAKHGGLQNSLELASMAKENGLKIQIGSLVGETGILTGAGVLLAMRVSGLTHLELGLSPRLLKNCPIVSGFDLDNEKRLTSVNHLDFGLSGIVDRESLFRRATLVLDSRRTR